MNIQRFVEIFHKTKLSLMVIQSNHVVYSSRKEGMHPLLDAVKSEKAYMKDALILDKVVGRAAALLLCYGKSKYVFADLMSKKAVEILEMYGVNYSCDQLTPIILNKETTDLCPFEKLVEKVFDPEEGYLLISKKVWASGKHNIPSTVTSSHDRE